MNSFAGTFSLPAAAQDCSKGRYLLAPDSNPLHVRLGTLAKTYEDL